jgi:hypothetical protein
MDMNGSEDIFRVYISGKTCAAPDTVVAIHEILNNWMTNGLAGHVWLAEEYLIHNL